MRRFLIFGAVMIMQSVAIVPVRALAQSEVGNSAGYGAYDGGPNGNSSDYAPPADNQGGVYPSGRYGYAPQPSQPYPAQSYPPQPYPSQPYPAQPYQSYPPQPYPAQPVPPQATSPNAVCADGRFFDHMTKTCESP